MGVEIIRRNKLEISVEILNAAIDGAKKTHIVYSANLNFDVVNRYLEMLEKKGLIEQNEDLYMTTEEGKKFKDMANKLKL